MRPASQARARRNAAQSAAAIGVSSPPGSHRHSASCNTTATRSQAASQVVIHRGRQAVAKSRIAAIRATLAAQCACDEAAFDAAGVVVTEAAERPGRLRFPVPAKPLLAVTLGAGVVISCHPSRCAWVRGHLGRADRDALFSAPLIARLLLEKR